MVHIYSFVLYVVIQLYYKIPYDTIENEIFL
jgi:hypothetical protein